MTVREIVDEIIKKAGVEPLPEDKTCDHLMTGSWDMEEITLKQGEFFIMPDDRENGLPDAAAMRVKQEQLIGRAAIRVAPFITVCVFKAK